MTSVAKDLLLRGLAVFPTALVSVIFAVALITAGAVLGVLAVIALGVHREECARSFTTEVTDRAARGARAANGLYTRMPRPGRQTRRHRQETLPSTGPRRPRREAEMTNPENRSGNRLRSVAAANGQSRARPDPYIQRFNNQNPAHEHSYTLI